MKNLKTTFIGNGGFKNPFKDGRSRNSFFYSNGKPKSPYLTKDGKLRKNNFCKVKNVRI